MGGCVGKVDDAPLSKELVAAIIDDRLPPDFPGVDKDSDWFCERALHAACDRAIDRVIDQLEEPEDIADAWELLPYYLRARKLQVGYKRKVKVIRKQIEQWQARESSLKIPLGLKMELVAAVPQEARRIYIEVYAQVSNLQCLMSSNNALIKLTKHVRYNGGNRTRSLYDVRLLFPAALRRLLWCEELRHPSWFKEERLWRQELWECKRQWERDQFWFSSGTPEPSAPPTYEAAQFNGSYSDDDLSEEESAVDEEPPPYEAAVITGV